MKKLFAEFPAVSVSDWIKVIEKDLKGQDYEKKLVWKTEEGFTIQPFYTEESIPDKPLGNPPSMPQTWDVIDEVKEADSQQALNQAKKSLESGAEGLKIHSIWNQNQVSGVKLESSEEIQKFSSELLDIAQKASQEKNSNIANSGLKLFWDTSSTSLVYMKAFATALNSKKSSLSFSVNGAFFQDPFNALTICGSFPQKKSEVVSTIKESIHFAEKNLPGYQTISVSGNNFAESGSSLTQEIAFSLAIGSEYLSLLSKEGLTPTQISRAICFRFSVGANYFHEIAKFRSFRFLWNQVLEAYGVSEKERTCVIYAETSSWNQSLFDPYVNMIRVTTESMSAVLGGVNSLHVQPFDSVYKEGDDFSKRIARNAQLLLRHESYLDKVVDPSSGSYYIDHLTYTFSENAWKLFQEVENEGGYIGSFQSGKIQSRIKSIAEIKKKTIQTKQSPILGTTQYPDFAEESSPIQKQAFTKVEKAPFPEFQSESDTTGELVPTWRAAEEFESLRLEVESISKKLGSTPNVGLLITGHRAMRTARASFATNFFGVAGFTITNLGGIDDSLVAINALIEKSPDIIVFCSSDEEYLELAKTICPMIRSKLSNTKIVIAGNPTEGQEEMIQAGVNSFIHARTPLLESLKKFVAGLN